MLDLSTAPFVINPSFVFQLTIFSHSYIDCSILKKFLKYTSEKFVGEALFENSVVSYDGTRGGIIYFLYNRKVVDMLQVQVQVEYCVESH